MIDARTSMGTAATTYAEHGWLVFPVAERAKVPLAGTAGFRDASADPLHALLTWQRRPTANVGVATGARTGLVVLDIDSYHDGLHTLQRLTAEHGPLPPTLTSRTGRGGYHAYFLHPGDGDIRCGAGQLGPGLDVRGDGGYVVAPPSIGPTGGRYVWVRRVSPKPLPPWLLQLIRPAAPPPATLRAPTPIGAGREAAYALAALEAEVRAVAGAPVGSRSGTLNRAGFCLGQLVAAGALLEADVVAQLVAASATNGHIADDGERAIRATIASGLRAGRAHPRTGRAA